MNVATTADPKTMLEQHRLFQSVMAAGRGVAAFKLSGQAPVYDKDLKDAAYAQQGLRAIVAPSKSQPSSSFPAGHKASQHEGLKGLGRLGVGIGADIIGHGLALALGGPVAGGFYSAFAVGRIAQGMVKAAGAAPQPSAGYFNNNATSGKGSVAVAPVKNPTGYKSFADEADQKRGVVSAPAPAPVKPKPGHAGYISAHRPGMNFNAITITPKDAKAAEHLLDKVNRQVANIGDLIHKPKMDAYTPGVMADARRNELSFADEADIIRHGGKISLAETGTVSAAGVRAFTQRHHQPSKAQQMVLAPSFA